MVRNGSNIAAGRRRYGGVFLLPSSAGGKPTEQLNAPGPEDEQLLPALFVWVREQGHGRHHSAAPDSYQNQI